MIAEQWFAKVQDMCTSSNIIFGNKMTLPHHDTCRIPEPVFFFNLGEVMQLTISVLFQGVLSYHEGYLLSEILPYDWK